MNKNILLIRRQLRGLWPRATAMTDAAVKAPLTNWISAANYDEAPAELYYVRANEMDANLYNKILDELDALGRFDAGVSGYTRRKIYDGAGYVVLNTKDLKESPQYGEVKETPAPNLWSILTGKLGKRLKPVEGALIGLARGSTNVFVLREIDWSDEEPSGQAVSPSSPRGTISGWGQLTS